MAEHPEALEAALRVVNANLIRYAPASLERGAAGIFLSVPATAESLTLPAVRAVHASLRPRAAGRDPRPR